MKRFFLPALIAFSAIGCSEEEEPPQAATEVAVPAPQPTVDPIDPAASAAAVEELESWDQVIEVLYDESLAVQWTIGVYDDGTRRHGLAETVCTELGERGLERRNTWVRIVDRPTVMGNGGDFRAASLGSVRCRTGDWLMP